MSHVSVINYTTKLKNHTPPNVFRVYIKKYSACDFSYDDEFLKIYLNYIFTFLVGTCHSIFDIHAIISLYNFLFHFTLNRHY